MLRLINQSKSTPEPSWRKYNTFVLNLFVFKKITPEIIIAHRNSEQPSVETKSITQLLHYNTESTKRDPVVHKRTEAPGHGPQLQQR